MRKRFKKTLVLSTIFCCMALNSCSANKVREGTEIDKKEVLLSTKYGNVTARMTKNTPANYSEFKYEIKDNEKGARIKAKAYRIIMPDGKSLWFLQSFSLQKGMFIPNPGDAVVEPISVDVSFLKEIDKEIEKMGIKNKIGNPKNPKMYVIFDTFCPYCIEAFKTKCAKYAQKYYISLIPLAVHGEMSVDTICTILEESKKENIKEVLGRYYSKFDGNWKKYEELFPKCKDKKLKKFIEKIRDTLIDNRVNGTPTYFFEAGGKFFKDIGGLFIDKTVNAKSKK